MNALDKVTDQRAEFYAKEGDLWPVCAFDKTHRGDWHNASSGCLSTTGFGEALDAYRRAAEWFASVD